MRKISQNAATAFINFRNYSNANTTVVTEIMYGKRTARLFLHGNEIACLTIGEPGLPNVLHVTTAGWASRTACERLNALPGVQIRTIKGVLMLNGRPWNGYWININDVVQNG